MLPVWSPYLKKDIDQIEKVQRRAARWICAMWVRSSYTWDKSYPECCSELSWLALETQRDMLTCCQVYKTINHLDCIPFARYFSFSGTHTRSHSLSLRCSHSRINAFTHSFFVRSPFLWNTLSFDIVSSSSYVSFKSKQISFYINQ